MPTNSILKWGFKAKAEKLAVEYREKLSISPRDPINAFDLAAFLNIPIYDATEFLRLPEEKARLSAGGAEDCGWSALTMVTAAGNKIIIHNPYHSSARQQSNIMHELSHIICEHEEGPKYNFPIPLGMRHFDEVQEEEAKCLGATLQLTRASLIWALKRNMSNEEIANYFNASIEMVIYRLNISGVKKQFSYYQ